MRVRLLLSTCVLFSCDAALYDDDLYFEITDETRADCIPSSAVDTYTYLGDRSHTASGQECLTWRKVYDINVNELQQNSQALLKYQKAAKSEEAMLHNKCRRWEMYPEHPRKSSAISTRAGPWCFIRKKDKIESERCFNYCKGQPREEKTELGKSQYGDKEIQKNYNDILIENIRKYYKSYSWGNASYYRWKPSDDEYSAEFYRIREQIFFGCVGTVVVLILWLLLCSYLRKEAAAARRRREEALKQIFPNRRIQMNPVVRPHVS